MLNDYILCITPRDDNFRPTLDSITRLIDFLDSKFYLEGPDRDLSSLVILPQKETKSWAEYVLQNQQAPVGIGSSEGTVTTPQAPLRKRYVHLLFSPTAPDEPYKNYNQLCNMIDNIQPRDTAFVAALGRGARNAWKALYLPLPGEERIRWILAQSISIVSGYHPIWRKIWDEQTMHKEWELVMVKAFKIVIGCKLNNRVAQMSIEEYVQSLQTSPDYQDFVERIGNIIGNADLELLGFDLR